MITYLSALASLLSFRFRSRASLELELLALRHQVTVLRRQRPGRLRLFCQPADNSIDPQRGRRRIRSDNSRVGRFCGRCVLHDRIKGVQDYNTKVIEFANANTEAAFAFAKTLSGVKSPSDFIELSTKYSSKQLETLTEQTKELAELAQKVTLATTESFKTGIPKAFGQST